MQTPQLILASSSRYRRKRLSDAGILHIAESPDIDESQLPEEQPQDYVSRLAREKAMAIAQHTKECLVIGCDQIAVLPTSNNPTQTTNAPYILGKSGSRTKAIEQLSQCSGKQVSFLTALCLVDTSVVDTDTSNQAHMLDETLVTFNSLTQSGLEKYIDQDEPYDCAGSFKMEKAGILLFSKVATTDPNALIGIPMIGLANCIQELGYSIFDFLG